MTHAQTIPIPFLEALKRIEELTRMIRTDGLDAFETIEGAFEEVRELRAVLGARIAEMRRMTN
jgi:pyridoxal biosynthesis lyase PdxS